MLRYLRFLFEVKMKQRKWGERPDDSWKEERRPKVTIENKLRELKSELAEELSLINDAPTTISQIKDKVIRILSLSITKANGTQSFDDKLACMKDGHQKVLDFVVEYENDVMEKLTQLNSKIEVVEELLAVNQSSMNQDI